MSQHRDDDAIPSEGSVASSLAQLGKEDRDRLVEKTQTDRQRDEELVEALARRRNG